MLRTRQLLAVASLGMFICANAVGDTFRPEFYPTVSTSGALGGVLGESEPLLAFGQLSRNIAIRLPPARNNLVPGVALEYQSNARGSFLGQGWDIPQDVIYRSRRFGVPQYRDIGQEPHLVFLEYRIGGNSGRLVYDRDVGTTKKLFRAKRDTLFAKFTYDSVARNWTVFTRDGRVRRLSVVDADPAHPTTRIFAWYVKTIRDPLGNQICYEHNYGAQSCNLGNTTYNRLQFIEYNGRYDGQSPGCLNRVQFQWGFGAQANASYTKGFRTYLDNEQLDRITVYGCDEAGHWSSVDYNVSWSQLSQAGGKGISKIQVRLEGGETLPATSYSYQPGAVMFSSTQVIEDSTSAPQPPSMPYWDDLSYGDDQYNLESSYSQTVGTLKNINRKRVKLVDWDGDGDLDQLVVRSDKTHPNLSGSPAQWFVRLNDGTRLGALQPLAHVPVQVTNDALEWTAVNSAGEDGDDAQSQTLKLVMDMNGDHRPDIVEGGYHPTDDPNFVLKIHVYLARADGTGWDPGQVWFPGSGSNTSTILRASYQGLPQYLYTYGELIDINGDGYTDYVWIEDHERQHAKVYLGSATGISQTSLDDGSGDGVPWPVCHEKATCVRLQDVVTDSPYTVETVSEFRDMNGDGIPDFVSRNPDTEHLEVVYGRGDALYVERDVVDLGPGSIDRVEGAAQVKGLYDMNGDGLLDQVMGPATLCGGAPHYLVWLNQGTEVGWRTAPVRCWFLPSDHSTCGNRYDQGYFMRAWDSQLASQLWAGYPGQDIRSDLSSALIDFNGDGFVEWVRGAKDIFAVKWTGSAGSATPVAETVIHDTPWCSFLGDLQQPGMLKKTSSETGVDEEFGFGRVPFNTPFPVRGITSVTHRDRNVKSPFDQYQVLYEYSPGAYDMSQRELRGCPTVTETQAGERVVAHHYHQGEFNYGAEHTTTVSDVFSPYPWFSVYTSWDTVDLVDPQSSEPRRWLRPGWIARRYFDPQTGAEQARRDTAFAYYGDPANYEDLNLGMLKHIEHVGAETSRYDVFTYENVNDDTKYLVRTKSTTRTTSPVVGAPVLGGTSYRYDDQCTTPGDPLDKGQVCDVTTYRGPGAVDGVWTFDRDPVWGTLTAVTDPAGTSTTLTWNPDHTAPATVTTDGKTVTLSDVHFLTGQPRRRCGPQFDGSTTACWSEELDGWGRVKKLYVPRHESAGFFPALAAEFSYSPQGGDPLSPPSVSMTLFPDGASTPAAEQQQRNWYFNGRGQVVLAEYALSGSQWGQVYQEHDKIGRPIRAWNPYPSTQSGPNPAMTLPPDHEFRYDTLNRLVETKAQQQIVQQTSFGASTATVTDATGRQTEYTFSPYGEVTTIIVDKNHQPLRHDIAYNALGLVWKVRQGQTDTHVYDYYADGTLYQATLQGGVTRTYSRGPDGRLASVTAPSGAQVAFSYDAMGRLYTRETISGGGLCPDRSSDRTDLFVYDEDSTNLGRLTSAHFGSDFTEEYNYDAQGVSTMHALVHQSHRLEVRYTNNLLGQRVEKQYVDTPGFSMGFELGKHGLPEALKIGGVPFGWVDYDTDLQVHRSSGDLSVIDSDAVTSYDRNFSYDARRRLSQTSGTVNGVAWNVGYDHDADGNVTGISDDLRNESCHWFYDGKSRLVEAYGHSASGVGEYGYSYNTDGTLDHASMPALGTTEQYAYSNGRVDQITDGTSTLWSYTWGDDGQMCVRDHVGHQRSELLWSADDRLTQIAAQGRVDRFVYDPAGTRIAQTDIHDQTTLFLDGAELNTATGEKVCTFEMPYARCEARDGNPARGKCYWYDYMNVAVVSDNHTGSLSPVHYSPFGRRFVPQGDDPQFGFNGQESVGQARELLDYGFRHYDPTARIFLSPDPLAMNGAPAALTAGMNVYSYAAQNPTSMMDILGLTPPFEGPFTPGQALESPSGPDAGMGSGPDALPPAQSPMDPLDAGAVGHPANMGLPPGVTSGDITFGSCAAGPELCAQVAGFHFKEAEYHGTNLAVGMLGSVALVAAFEAAVDVGVGLLVRAAATRLGPWVFQMARAAPLVGAGQQAARRGVEVLQPLAQGGGPTTTVFTNLSQAPVVGRALSVATGPNARALVDAFAKQAGRIYQAEIPTRLIVELERLGLVTRAMHSTATGLATEIRFLPGASEFIVGFFK